MLLGVVSSGMQLVVVMHRGGFPWSAQYFGKETVSELTVVYEVLQVERNLRSV